MTLSVLVARPALRLVLVTLGAFFVSRLSPAAFLNWPNSTSLKSGLLIFSHNPKNSGLRFLAISVKEI